MQSFLTASEFLDFTHPIVAEQASALRRNSTDNKDLIARTFYFVRDEIKHSSDFKLNRITCKASDVLLHGTGYCYAKSHLLAALLRANGVPAGLCYQRLSVSGVGAPYCLHGLNAVFMPELGWYRLDARGNKPGIDAQFTPPIESLAFPIQEANERDLPEVWAEPLASVVACLQRYETYDQVLANLPDVELFTKAPP